MKLCDHGMPKHLCRLCELESVQAETETIAEVKSVKWEQLELFVLRGIRTAQEDKDVNYERAYKAVLGEMDRLQREGERFIANYFVATEGKES